ncbi:hypothetical protein BGZ83_004466 [Gryganskiella cystojenkinii]|nr:hypothetical protein BGZ83_004466 [Gryganskiella cystojenkinii]
MSEKRKEVRYIAQKFANAILSDASSYIISTDGLQALNAFLDELLFILIDTAKGMETSRIKASVYQTFPTALGKNAIVEAELEAKSYLDMGGKDTSNHLSNNGQSGTSAMFNADSDESRVEQVFEQFRAKCQYYSKLGERLGSPAGNPSNSIVVPTLIAIYVTAVLEHVAEYVLQVASTVADRQDHADMVTVREIYVALLEDRQIENIFEIMILKSQLQKRFRNSLIMPGLGSRQEETPATVKRSGSWGKQLRLGNADKPKLDVQLPTDVEDDVAIDPNRPQFGDWDEPPDAENKQKKKNDFEMLFSSGETMKVSLTPNRLRTIEVHRKVAGGMLSGNVASRSSSRAASVLGGKEGKENKEGKDVKGSHARRPSHGDKGTAGPVGRKNSQAGAEVAPSRVPALPATPNVPAIPASFGVSQPIMKKQGAQTSQSPNLGDQPPLSPMQHMQLRQQQQQPGRAPGQQQEYHGLGIANNKRNDHQEMDTRTSTSTFGSAMTLSTAGVNSIASPSSPSHHSQSPVSPTGSRHSDGSLKATTQATNDLVQFLGNTSPSPSFSEKTHSTDGQQPPMSATFDAMGVKKENPIKSFMGRLGRNSMQQRTSMESINGSNSSQNSGVSPAPINASPTSPRSFTITGQHQQQIQQQQQMSPVTLSSSYYSDLQQYNQQSPTMNNRTPPQQQQQQQQQLYHQQSPAQNNRDLSGFPLPPAHSHINNNSLLNTNNNGVVPPPLNMHGVVPGQHSPLGSPVQQHLPMSPADAHGIPIPSRNASLNHDITSPTRTTFPASIPASIHTAAANSAYEAATRTGLEAGLPRPLSPRPASPKPASPGLRPSSPRPSSPSPLQNSTPASSSPSSPSVPHHFHQLRNNQLDGQPPVPGSLIAPSPLSNSISSNQHNASRIQGHHSNDASPSSSSTSLIPYGKVNHIQDRLAKTSATPIPGFKPQDHLLNQSNPNRISLEGTIRANPFYQQDKQHSSPSVRSSIADLSSNGGDSPKNSGQISSAGKFASIEEKKQEMEDTEQQDQDQEPEETTIHDLLIAASSSSSDADSDIEVSTSKRHLISPATSPEMMNGASSGFKDRLPSATTRTLTAAAAASKQQLKHQQSLQNLQQTATPPTSESQRFESTSPETTPTTVQDVEHKANVNEEEEEDDSEHEVVFVAPVMRATSAINGAGVNRNSIFVDETAQAMDRLSRQRHRQSMRLEDEDYESEEDEDDDEGYEYDHDDMTQGIQPPEKWHYSDLEDSDEEEEDSDDESSGARRRKHESFMSAKSVLMPYSSTVSLVDGHNRNDTQDDDEDEEEEENKNTVEVAIDALEIKESFHRQLSEENLRQQQQQEQALAGEFTAADFVKGDEYVNLVSSVAASTAADRSQDEEDEDAEGEDEDESEDSEDLEDNDDEEGQDRRIYLQQLRIQRREARRLERLANPSAGKSTSTTKKVGRKSKKDVSPISANAETESVATTTGSDGASRKKTLRKGHSKENLRRQQDPDRPQTPTTPVPTTQIIPLTPTDLVLIRQKLFAAGNFEASMRMLDTIFHAAMAKMVEGRERGVQTEPVSFLQGDEIAKDAVKKEARSAAAEADSVKKEVKRSSSTSTSTSTSMDTEEQQQQQQQPVKQLQWVTVAVEQPVAPVADDDDEDRVVEWLLGGV